MNLPSATPLVLVALLLIVLVVVLVRRRKQPPQNSGQSSNQLVVSGLVGEYLAPTEGTAGRVTIAGMTYAITVGTQIQGDVILVTGQRAAIRGTLDANGQLQSGTATAGITVPMEIYALEVVYLIVLLATALLFNDPGGAHDLWKLVHLLPDPVGPIPLAIPWYGALGAVTIGLFGLFQHANSWDEGYRNWHIARPLTGATLGLLAYLIFLVVIDATGTEAKKAGHPEFVYYLIAFIIAFIVGFREETFTTLIKRAADLFIGPGDGGNQATH